MGGGATNYLETEQVVGTWINGKPVYQITKDFGQTYIVNSTGVVIPAVAADIDLVLFAQGIGPSKATGAVYYNADTNKAWCAEGLGMRYMTILYTKTTD